MKTILVTGGNRGIGLAIVKGLAKSKDNLVLMGCRDAKAAEDIASSIGENVKPVLLDLSDRDTLSSHLDDIQKKHKQIDGLVNNAGIISRNDFLGESLEEFDLVTRVNTVAPFEIIKKLLPLMIENDYGRIVNVSSDYGSFESGLSGPFSYSLSKAALNAITVSASKGLPNNVKVNSICPGWVRSDMGGESAPRSTEKGAETATWLMLIDQNGPSGKFFRDKQEIGW